MKATYIVIEHYKNGVFDGWTDHYSSADALKTVKGYSEYGYTFRMIIYFDMPF